MLYNIHLNSIKHEGISPTFSHPSAFLFQVSYQQIKRSSSRHMRLPLAVLLVKYCRNKFTMAISSKERVKNEPRNLILKVTLRQEIRSWFVGNSGKAEDCSEGTDLAPPQT